ncbi:cytochrome c oxidase assembly protein [Crenobacter sp. SG2305]|uniref:cytochrome c oxidase assembly protein n=1 Tax=Crenobacter oryzisoli TaxID=3056844 RepID=UPI0025AA8174|nr:cytochrome c oxidase assembly protein [Crenobacter sp. SG2305]MDN0084304.1 cytochrome c oxidase assembly protein [Crenobacter sp. SG2305]
MESSQHSANLVLLKKLAIIALVMFGFAWALVPMYRVICEATGLNQIAVADAAPMQAGTAGVQVEMVFDSMVQAGLPWQVRPLTSHLKAKTGEFIRVDYEITNASDRRMVGQAVPRYLPAAAGEYVKKLDCFCFKQQSFEPGQTKRFPVVFVIDPKMPRDISTITLAYSIFEVPGQGGS